MASKIQNLDISLKDLVSEIQNGHYTIPKFQRDFVWKSSDISSLGDSIIRGYPISSLLVMPCNGSLQIETDPLKTNEARIDVNYSKLKYVLDGQQRLTAIAKIFLNYDIDKRYYFDLYSMLLEKFPEDKINYNTSRNLREDNDSFCRYFPKGKNKDEEPTKHNYRYISGLTIMEDKSTSVISRFLKNLEGLQEDKYEEYLDYLSATLSVISSYGVPTTIIAEDADLGLVCRVFEKVNSSGIKLTTFDLINAKSFSSNNEAYAGGIASYISNQLIKYIDKLDDTYKYDIVKTLESFLGFDKENNKFSDLARLIRLLYIQDLIKNNKKPLLTNYQMLSKESNFWFQTWDKNKENFFKFIEWIAKEKIVNLGPASFLEYIGAIIVDNIQLLNILPFLNHIKKLYLSIGIRGLSFSKSDIDDLQDLINEGREIINIHGYQKQKLKLSNKYKKLLENSDIEKFIKGRDSYKISLYIMFNENFNGKFTHDLLGHNIKKDGFDEHHLVPKAHTKGKTGFNGISNITLLNKDSNRNEIKDKSLKDYMSEIKILLGEDKFIKYCEMNLIPYNFIDNENDFIRERANLIKNYLNEYFE